MPLGPVDAFAKDPSGLHLMAVAKALFEEMSSQGLVSKLPGPAAKHADPLARTAVTHTSETCRITLSGKQVEELTELLRAMMDGVKAKKAMTTSAAAPTATAKVSASQPRDASAEANSIWAMLKAKLPTAKTPEGLAARNKLWPVIDPNGNGYVSVAEAHAFCKFYLGLESFTPNLQPIVLRAHKYAKTATKAKPGQAAIKDDYVERSEFRVFLQYLYNYFELYSMFAAIDKDGNRKLTLEEFTAAVPMIQEWGLDLTAPGAAEKVFREVDTNNGGEILFDEFVVFAAQNHLDLDGDADNIADMDERANLTAPRATESPASSAAAKQKSPAR